MRCKINIRHFGRKHVGFNADFKQPKLKQHHSAATLLGGYLFHGQLACQWGQIVGNQMTTATSVSRCTATLQHPWLCNNVRAIVFSWQRALSAKNKVRETPHGCSQETQYCCTHKHTWMYAHVNAHHRVGTHWLPWVCVFYLNHSSLSQQVSLSFKAPTDDSRGLKCSIRDAVYTHTHTQWDANCPPTVTSLNYYPWEFHSDSFLCAVNSFLGAKLCEYNTEASLMCCFACPFFSFQYIDLLWFWVY